MRMRGHETSRGRWIRAAALGVVVCGMLAIPSVAQAQVELTGVIGGMLGGDLNNLIEGTSSLKSTFDNGPLYGARLGWIGGWIGAEGSFVTSPTGVKLEVPGSNLDLDAKVYYAEFNALLIPIPGPVSPFFTIGVRMPRTVVPTVLDMTFLLLLSAGGSLPPGALGQFPQRSKYTKNTYNYKHIFNK
jgi:hypothetical protein